MDTRYGGALALGVLLLVTACSSGDDSARTDASPTASASGSPTASASATASPAARSGATPSVTPSPRPSPRPTAGQPSPTPTRAARATASPTPSPTRRSLTYAVRETAPDRFDPNRLSLRVGDRVRVTYDDPTGAPHDFVIEALKVDSGPMADGDTFAYRFTRTGTFTFVCSYHQRIGMTGTVTVRP
jgi:plastocyanin